ncbi:hypothetical protein MBAV_003989 [Candidatus Magnetobacterium bavaricum]|uniref:Capsid protein n=1 Tax=Candidatus Magnetobacterium bavaricum TaxID=29290 RepID=A0A0F3GPE1_9BACT|nr:hypothetical protein MBAV_003989 [Candidatus Magnetobacterium bavaricum]
MALAKVSGYPDYGSSSQGKFSRAIWSGKLLAKYYATSVITDISNTTYEGDIKEQGDLVYIRAVPDITIRDYVKGQKLEYDNPDAPPAVDLLIDKGKYFAFTCDDVDKWQSDIDLLDLWSSDAAEQLKVVIDSEVLSAVPSQAHSSNMGDKAGKISGAIDIGKTGAPIQITKTNVLDYIVDCASVLDEQNIPETGRWLVIPAWLAGMIKKSDLKDAALTNDTVSILRNGRIGSIDRFDVYSSNHVGSVVDTGDTVNKILFGHRSALTFASQIIRVETLRAESTFGDLVRGLHVYGFKVIKPEGLGVLYAMR